MRAFDGSKQKDSNRKEKHYFSFKSFPSFPWESLWVLQLILLTSILKLLQITRKNSLKK